MFAAGSGHAQVLEVAITPIAPLFTVSEQGVAGGILTELLTRTLDKVDVPYTVRVYPPKRLLRNLMSGVSTVSIGVKNNKSQADSQALYSKNPVYRLELQVYSLASKPLVERIEDLLGESVGLLRGYHYGTGRKLLAAPSNNGRIVEVNSHLSGVTLLRKNRIDYFLDYRQAGVTEAVTQGSPLHQRTLQSVDMYFIVSKTHPRAQQLMTSMEQAHSESRW